MKHEKEFNYFYHNINEQYEDVLKQNKKKAIRNILLFLILSVVIIFVGYKLYEITKQAYIFYAFAFADIYIMMPLIFKNIKINTSLCEEVEKQMWNTLFKKYKKGKHIPRDTVKSEIVKTNYIIGSQEPYIRTINDKDIECKEIQEYSIDAEGNRYISFHGFIITITGIKNPYKCIYKYKHNFYEENELNKVTVESLNKYKVYTNDQPNTDLVNKLYELEKDDLLKADIYEDKDKTIIIVSIMDTVLKGKLNENVVEKAYKKIYYINELIEFICK